MCCIEPGLLYILKGTPAWDFYLRFFCKKTIWSPDSYPEFVSNIKIEFALTQLTLSSVYASKLINVLANCGPNFLTFHDTFFSKCCLFKDARCLQLLSSSSALWVDMDWVSLSTESMLSETVGVCQLNQDWVRLHVDWANVEWDSMSIESTWNSPIFKNIAPFHIDSVDMWYRSHWLSRNEVPSALTHLMENDTLCQLNHCKMICKIF